jgi:putative DNA primase/helicase
LGAPFRSAAQKNVAGFVISSIYGLMSVSVTAAAKDAVKRLNGTWHGSYGKARCPAHEDRSPSLSITPGRAAVLFHCFAGCAQADVIAALAAKGGYVRPTKRDVVPQERRDLAPLARELWGKALPLAGTPAQRYLERRRIGHSTIGRFDPAAMTYEGGKRLRLPALLLPIIERRQLVALARVFVDGDGNKHPQLADPKRTLADPRGGAVQIGAIEGDHLNLAEGFEEAESVIAKFGLPGCWSVNGTELYARIHIPDHIRSITVYSQHGKAARTGLEKAESHLRNGGRALQVELPPPGGDWNDAWRAEQ